MINMCQAHILRFSCGHGILMHVDTCHLGPCPSIKTTGAKLPQQPYRCYKCQARRAATFELPSPIGYGSSHGGQHTQSNGVAMSSLSKTKSAPSAPSSVQYSIKRPRLLTQKSFVFSCATSDHYATPHYTDLPEYLPHQSHPCPQCELQNLRSKADVEAIAQAMAEFPRLRGEMLVRNGRIREDWQSHLTQEKYVDEKRAEEKQMWLFVCKKWTQDLKKARVLVAQEDGLALFV